MSDTYEMAVRAGDRCPQCKIKNLHPTGEVKNGQRILSCLHCGWRVREGT